MAAAGIAESYNERTGELTDNARVVLQRRYLAKDREGNVLEAPDGMFRRVAHNLSQSDLEYGATEAERQATEDAFYQVMRRLEFLPNSPTLMNAGRELQQLSACFVLPVEDSLDSIFTKVKQTALIHKSGGGTGFAFSRLRPEGDVVGSTGGVASGPVSFINAFDAATDVVKQGGTRRGANMGILHVTHPDILSFITSKEDGQHLSNFNISVAVTEDFMRRVEHDQAYDLVNPRTGQIAGQLNAREVFERMTELAWRTGDPGIVFLDRINRDNPNPQLGDIESTNPCGEQPLLPYESCNLGSLNLARMVRYDDDDIAIDWSRMSEVIKTAVHMLDSVIDMNDYPIDEIADMSRKTRRIGLGVMGWSDLLIQMGFRYDSDEALELAEQVMEFIQRETYRASEELSEARGTFPEWERSAYNRGENPQRMRNSAPVTIAPTGTISIIAGASSGIEPLFALSFVRNVMDRTRLVEGNNYFEAVAHNEGFYSEELMEQLAAVGSLEDLDVPGWVKEVFRVSHDIDPRWHVRMQGAFQKYTDNAVSKTINFPHDATVEDVAEAYQSAYAVGCKGITVYRDGSKAEQVLSTGATDAASESGASASVVEIEVPGPRVPRERPRQTRGITERVRTGHGNMYVTVNLDADNKPFEVFGTMGKAGGCDAALLEAVSRLVSLALRAGIDTSEVTRQLRGITCCPAWDDGTLVRSGPDAVAIVLDKLTEGMAGESGAPDGVQLTLPTGFPGYGGDGPDVRSFLPPGAIVGGSGNGVAETGNGNGHGNGNGYTIPVAAGVAYSQRCPECNGSVVNQEGCSTCYSCGWNKCE
ncbi:MAG: vitamin B12-dependent ribonucleotide reductase [Chloroflexi bacterium]|nr:vitamin B12-dependent ribonucleotide reductase [Chloroflexota bacterium]